jgi:hypothetical protein
LRRWADRLRRHAGPLQGIEPRPEPPPIDRAVHRVVPRRPGTGELRSS